MAQPTLDTRPPAPVVPPPADGSLRPPWDRRRVRLTAVLVTLVGLTVLSARHIGLSFGTLVDGFDDVRRLLERMVPPELSTPGETVSLVVETFFIAFAGTFLALVLSIPIAFLAARNTTPGRAVAAVANAVVVGCRAVPDLVFALVFVRALGIGVLPGILAIGLHSIGMLGKLFAASIEEIDEGPREATMSVGATRLQVLAASVVPQLTPSFIGLALHRLDINVRTSTVLGFVGAGGIGLQLRATLGSLRYPEALGIAATIFVLILAVEIISSSVRRRLLGNEAGESAARLRPTLSAVNRLSGRMTRRSAGPVEVRPDRVDPTDGTSAPVVDTRTDPLVLPFDQETLRPPWTPERRSRFGFGLLFLIGLVASFRVTGVHPLDLFRAIPDIVELLPRFFPPDLSTGRDTLIDAMVETVSMAFVATFIGSALALPVAFLAARNVAPATWIYRTARYSMVLVRGVPELMLAVVFVAAVGLGPFAGVLALSIGAIGFTGKLFADAIEEAAQGPRDAVLSTGASRLQETATSVVPQVLPSLVGSVLYTLDVNVRAATVLGIVGAGGIGYPLNQAIRTLQLERAAGIILLVFVVVYAIERLSGWVRGQLI